MSNVPAWKRIGLKVKADEDAPILLSTQLATSEVTTKQIKKIKKQTRNLKDANQKEDGEKKAPKREKVPKSERGEGPEKDQLAYLIQFENDKANWKFSKQKQNWILRHIKEIPSKYESALLKYMEGMNGTSRDRMVESWKASIGRWNELAEIAERKIEQELQSKLKLAMKAEKKEGEEDDSDDEVDPEEVKKLQEKLEKLVNKNAKVEDNEPDYEYVIRCRKLVLALTDEKFELKGIDEDEAEEAANEEVAPAEDAPVEVEKSNEDNIIYEEVDVDEYSPTGSKRSSPESQKSKKKSKKSKKSKKE